VKLHDLRPAPGSHTPRTRVGRGIAAGKGKTAGRGTKGQKSRAGAAIPAWFEGGQTPAHIRLPKLHGFTQRNRIDYQVVNVGRISDYAVAGRLGGEPGTVTLTVNSETLRAAGLISTERRPVKILGHGDVTVSLFVAAEAFTKSAQGKIEGAGGFVQVVAPETEPSAARVVPTVHAPTGEAPTPAVPALTVEPGSVAEPEAEAPAAAEPQGRPAGIVLVPTGPEDAEGVELDLVGPVPADGAATEEEEQPAARPRRPRGSTRQKTVVDGTEDEDEEDDTPRRRSRRTTEGTGE
jgi:large subunit ribosomal protein L15